MINPIYQGIDWFSSLHHYYRGKFYLYGETVKPEREMYMRMIARHHVESHDRPISILEIGSYRGKSALIWAEYGKVYCVDVWKDYVQYLTFRRNIKLAKKVDKISAVRGNSRIILPMLKDLKFAFDLIYIDGDHTYEGCLIDIINANVLLDTNGIICGDDYDEKHPGVIQAVQRFFGPEGFNNYNGFFVRK